MKPYSKPRFAFLRFAVITVLIGLLAGCSGIFPAAGEPAGSKQRPVPLLAYYYIWFDTTSWDRAKTDFPLLGRYSSNSADVMRQHVRWAKAAGIDGFIVSWKSSDALNRRLEQLIKIAGEENFKLALIFQGLDFERSPLPAARIAADLDLFASRYAGAKAFNLFSKPLVIWSGTWEFSPNDIASVTQTRRDQLLILASERNSEGYRRLSTLVDGNAYYWSSVNPDKFPNYGGKLNDMGSTVRASGGLWIAPASPGFDARLVGGTTVVERRDGETLRRAFATATQSSPDAVGLISWNEFSENTHIEPSMNFGRRFLDVVAEIKGRVVPPITDFDSSAPGDTATYFDFGRLMALGGLGILIIASVLAVGRRRSAPPRA